MEILCFRGDKEQHNISCFTEVFGRYEKLPMDYIGLPAVNIDYEDGKVYASIGLVQNIKETILIDEAFSVSLVRACYHFFKLFVRHILTKFYCYLS